MLSQAPYAWVDEKRRLVEATFVVYKDEAGKTSNIVVQKAKPTQAEIEAAVAARKKGY